MLLFYYNPCYYTSFGSCGVSSYPQNPEAIVLNSSRWILYISTWRLFCLEKNTLAGALSSFAVYKSLHYIMGQEIQNSIPCCVTAPSCPQTSYSALCPHLFTFGDILDVEEPTVHYRRLKPREKTNKKNYKPELSNIKILHAHRCPCDINVWRQKSYISTEACVLFLCSLL